jgi:hypothetical protein
MVISSQNRVVGERVNERKKAGGEDTHTHTHTELEEDLFLTAAA